MGSEREGVTPTALDRAATIVWHCALVGAGATAIWMFYLGVKAIMTETLNVEISLRHSGPWFPKPLHGISAVFAGFSFISLALSILSICAVYGPGLQSHLPKWARFVPWIFFIGWVALKLWANHIASS